MTERTPDPLITEARALAEKARRATDNSKPYSAANYFSVLDVVRVATTIDALATRVEQGAALIDGLTHRIAVERPSSGLAKGRLTLKFYIGALPDEYYGLTVASNSYDEAALNEIGGWLNQMRAFLATTSAPPSKPETKEPR